jgi:hypothetical protein
VARRTLIVTLIALTTVTPARSQDAPSAPSYLMRLVHAHTYENLCVLLRGDGQYHFERETAAKTDVYEGMLAQPELQRVQRLVSADELFSLDQDRSLKPASVEQNVQVVLSIHRPGHWQNLTFATADSWDTYRDSVVPLLAWLDEMRRAKNRTKLREEISTNHCLPPPKLELKTRR